MNEIAPESLTVLPDPTLFRTARWIQRLCIGAAAILILFELLPLIGISLGDSPLAAARGHLPLLVTAVWIGVSLVLSEPGRTGVVVGYARRIANILAAFAAVIDLFWMRTAASGANPGLLVFPPARLILGFVLLTLIVLLLDNTNWLVNRFVDVLMCSLCLLALFMVSDVVFGWFALFGRHAVYQGAPAVLACMVALTAVTTLRQAEHGVFSIFLGVGIGSRLARMFAPILILLPFAWEVVTTRLAGQLSAGLVVSAAIAFAVGFLLFFAWRISSMENEIHELVLRDEATRLYNIKGFHMLAEHALRLAQRSNVPFSLLFISIDNLAQIQAKLGTSAVAASLAETGEILRTTFRESDIKGRVGASEFAVAGQFDRAGISVAALRLEAVTATRNAKNGRPIPLKFSTGHVTTSEANMNETLKDLLTRAGQVRHQQDSLQKELRVN